MEAIHSIKLFQELGFEVCVISKLTASQTPEMVTAMSEQLGGVQILTAPFVKQGFSWERLNPFWLDGASYEYQEPVIQKLVEDTIVAWRPDVVWLEYSFLWPLIKLAHKYRIPVVLRTANVESWHLLSDEGFSLRRLISAFSKFLGELYFVRVADAVLGVTPNETDFYHRIGARYAALLPTRQLAEVLLEAPVPVHDTSVLDVLVSGATYSVGHNRTAAAFAIRQVAPLLEAQAPGEFRVHITGAKLPPSLATDLPPNVVYEGYVPDFSAFLKGMDIALSPSVGGAGMQVKVFDPITRGIPTVTMPRAIAGYPFVGGTDVLLATTAQEAADALLALRSRELRERIGASGRAVAEREFSKHKMQERLRAILAAVERS